MEKRTRENNTECAHTGEHGDNGNIRDERYLWTAFCHKCIISAECFRSSGNAFLYTVAMQRGDKFGIWLDRLSSVGTILSAG